MLKLLHNTLKQFSVYTMQERNMCNNTFSTELLKGTKNKEKTIDRSLIAFFCTHCVQSLYIQAMKEYKEKTVLSYVLKEKTLEVRMQSS